MLILGRTPLLCSPPGCLRAQSQTGSLYRIAIPCHPTLTPPARSLLVHPLPHSQRILSNRPEVSTGLKRERDNYMNAGAFYFTLRQPSTCLYHWWSIKAKERHLQIKDEVMETFFWNTVVEPHCKNIIKKWRFTEHVAIWHTSQIKPMRTVKFSLNPISILIPHALRFVCSLSDLFPSAISKEQMGVLHTHPLLPSTKTNSKYLWPPVHSPSLALQYPPFTSAYSFVHAHVLQSLLSHSYFSKHTLFRIFK